MKKYLAALSTTALMSFAPFALAASSTDLTVTGFITPSACTPSLAGGGVVDLGKIPVKDLNPDPDSSTRLSPQSLQLTVACNSATLLAFDPTDNKSGTEYRTGAFGLGLTNTGEKVGHFWVVIDSAQADGQPVNSITSIDNGENWTAGDVIITGAITSISAYGTDPLPITATNVLVGLDIQPHIAPTNSLTLTDEVTIDGSITIDVKYL